MIDTKHIPAKYRPVPFWSWNEKLTCAETRRQAEMMADMGMGGFFMHARGGLETAYMSEEWFANIEAGIRAAEEKGITPWAYDENGWPSGFGGGIVNGKGVKYQQKYLRMEPGEKQTDTTIANVNGRHFYYEVNPFYVDTLDGAVIADFLEEIYQPYYERFGNRIAGFFTDEPQVSRDGIPWSLILPEEYQNAYGQDLLPHLNELFEETGDYQTTRIRFWKLVTDLFSRNFMKQIYDWCDARGLQLTGHLVQEETPEVQVTSNGACMPHYEYFHIPGIDWLSRNIKEGLAAIQGCSVAQQLGREQFLTESFALCGHNVSFSELRGVFEWQMVRGATLLCPHLEGYSLRGIRKRDYPPAMYEQQPWWPEYQQFIESMSRIGMLLTRGEVAYNTLLLHPQTTAWVCFNNGENPGLDKLTEAFFAQIKALDEKHILFHLGDETVMERHGKAEGNALVIGTQKYRRVIRMPGTVLLESTEALLKEFAAGGGEIIEDAAALPENPVADNPALLYTARQLEGETLHYLVNITGKPQKAKVLVGDRRIDIDTGEVVPFGGEYEFLPYDSLLVVGAHELQTCHSEPVEESPLAAWGDPSAALRFAQDDSNAACLDLSGEWRIAEPAENALTLDTCDYYFDGELQEAKGYVLNIQARAYALKRPIALKQVYKVQVKQVPKEIYLVCETPEQFAISVNGVPLVQKDCGFFRDRSFRKLDMGGMLKTGENEIVFTCEYRQSAEVYENIAKSMEFESEKNKLTFDMEVEPVYLVGDFSVTTPGTFTPLGGNDLRYRGGFILDAPKTAVTLAHLEQQGFPFFAGRLVVERTVAAGEATRLCLERKGINAILAEVNGHKLISIWNGEAFDLAPYLCEGENHIRLTLVNNLHNLLGPHHLEEGESLSVRPASFYKEPCVWKSAASFDWAGSLVWNDGYTLVETSV